MKICQNMSNASYKDLPSLKELKTTYFLENVKNLKVAFFGYYLYLRIQTYKSDICLALSFWCQIVFFNIQRRLFYSTLILYRDGRHGFPGGRASELDAAFRSTPQVEPQGQHHSGKQHCTTSKYKVLYLVECTVQ
jgi:hypothetical protein